jgi:6-phosphogluconolactonase (cycloisomerase 2 family)
MPKSDVLVGDPLSHRQTRESFLSSALSLIVIEAKKNGQGGVDGLAGAHATALDPQGKHVYVASFSGAVAAFARDQVTGALTFVEAEKDGQGGVDGLAGAGAIAIAPGGAHVYVTGGFDNAVAVFTRDGVTGALTFLEVKRDGVDGIADLTNPRGIAVSPDGSYVVAGAAAADALVLFRRDVTTGRLTFMGERARRRGRRRRPPRRHRRRDQPRRRAPLRHRQPGECARRPARALLRAVAPTAP